MIFNVLETDFAMENNEILQSSKATMLTTSFKAT